MAELGIFILYNIHASRLLHIKLDQIHFFQLLNFCQEESQPPMGYKSRGGCPVLQHIWKQVGAYCDKKV